MDTYVSMAESLCYSLETATALSIRYTIVQNVFGVKKIN